MTSSATGAERRPLQLADMFRFERIADPQISPDGKLLVYVVTQVDLAANSSSSTLWLAPTDGGPRRPLTNTSKKDRHPRWSPDGKQVLFESNRGGDTQLWTIDLTGGEARQLTSISSEASTGTWSPDGKWIAFVSSIYPEFSSLPYAESNKRNKERADQVASNPVKARVFDRLFYRHWDSWVEGKRQHLFVMPAAGGDPRDVTPGDRDAYPTSTTFSLGDDFTFTPDSKALIYTGVPQENEAWSTNFDLFRVPIEGGDSVNLTTGNLAADSCPRFSPDGQKIAYRAQAKPGYEADRWQLMIMDARGGTGQSITPEFDSSVDSFVWAPDGKSLYFVAEDRAHSPIYRVPSGGGKPAPVVRGGVFGSLSISRDDKLGCTQATMQSPAEAYLIQDGQTTNLSQVNKTLLAELDLPAPESVDVPGAGGQPMQMWILKPPGFDPQKKWPVVYLVHGGPQGAWDDNWSFRWNPQLWAAQGYVIALPNPRGSTGFGQKYVDEISGDWGGRCYDDLMGGVAYLEKQPFVDTNRMAAAGASFGGYMMNWFLGRNEKFKTFITHCGVYNFDSMYSTTDELWFDEWEHGGPPWVNRQSYEKHSPHKFAKEFKTPVLIIHNDLDFRVPVSEGYQLFTTLQRLGVPSKMINFPDEGHWVLKPANSEFWHQEVFAWLKQYVPPGPR